MKNLRFSRSLAVLVAFVILGVLPVSGCFGSCSPLSCILGGVRDLGVKYTAADLQSAVNKIGMQVQQIPASATTAVKDTLKYSGQKVLQTAFNNSELTALMNNTQWKFNPLSNVQLKVGNNGLSEFSGQILTDRLAGFAEWMGASADELRGMTDMIKMVGGNPSVYIKSTASVVNGKMTAAIQSASIGMLDLGQDQLKEVGPSLVSFMQSSMTRVPGLSVKNLTLNNAMANFDGTVPAIKYVMKP